MTLNLVTGGTGFLGQHLVRLLREEGRPVRVLARPGSDRSVLGEVDVVSGDVTEPQDLRRALQGVQRVFHLAAELRDGRPAAEYEAVNVRAVGHLLELATEMGVERVVHTSSYLAIGRSGEPRAAPDQVCDEYWTHDPSDMHDAHEQSKYDAEHLVNQQVSLGRPVLALIPTMMYGPELGDAAGAARLRPGNRVTAMLSEHAAGAYPGLPGSGQQVWNLVHVEDVARGHLRAMDFEDGSGAWPPPTWQHWHYILGGENTTLASLFDAFGRFTGVAPPAPLGRGGRLGRWLGSHPYRGRSKQRFERDSHSWAYTSAMASADFAYASRPLEEGLGQTVEWMRQQGMCG